MCVNTIYKSYVNILFLLFLYHSCNVNLKFILFRRGYNVEYLLMMSITHITNSKFSKVK